VLPALPGRNRAATGSPAPIAPWSKAPAWPFRTFDGPRGFGTYWRDNDMSGSWKSQAGLRRAAPRSHPRRSGGPARAGVRAPVHQGAVRRLQGPDLRCRRREAADRAARRGEQRRRDRPQRGHLPCLHRPPAAQQGLTWRQMVAWWTKCRPGQ
jgi:hypothetical protein